MENIEKLISNGIMAIIPLYIDMKGNSTKVKVCSSNDLYIYKSIRSVLTLLARYFMINLNASRRHYGRVIGCKNIVPIPFDKNNIFVPLKVRKPISKNDGSFGYFNLNRLKRIDKKENHVQIILENDSAVNIIQSYDSVSKHIKDAKLVKHAYYERSNQVVKETNVDFYKEYNRPATKGDIAALRNEIIDMIKLCGS